MNIRSQIGMRIRMLRQSQQPPLSLHRLAVIAEVDPGQLSRAERGMAGMSLDALSRIAEALGTSLASLLGAERDEAAEPERAYRAMSPTEALAESIWRDLRDAGVESLEASGQALIRHLIRSNIEEGAMRARALAERELRRLREVDGRG